MVNASGPIARRLLRDIEKIGDLRAVRPDPAVFRESAGGFAAEHQFSAADRKSLEKAGPGFAAYVCTQHWMSDMAEALSSHPALSKLVKLIDAAEEEYLPAGPPLSPLTSSYFISWALFDAAVGEKRETIASLIVAVGEAIGTHEVNLRLARSLQRSRMSICVCAGRAGSSTVFRELVTGEEFSAVVASGYRGKKGELWLARVLPPPFEGTPHVVFTTPYVILHPGEGDWLAYFARTLPKVKAPDEKQAYEQLMKYGLAPRYWSEYIFEAYVNHLDTVIFLAGLPDIDASRPHSRVNSHRW